MVRASWQTRHSRETEMKARIKYLLEVLLFIFILFAEIAVGIVLFLLILKLGKFLAGIIL